MNYLSIQTVEYIDYWTVQARSIRDQEWLQIAKREQPKIFSTRLTGRSIDKKFLWWKWKIPEKVTEIQSLDNKDSQYLLDEFDYYTTNTKNWTEVHLLGWWLDLSDDPTWIERPESLYHSKDGVVIHEGPIIPKDNQCSWDFSKRVPTHLGD
jgi:hypothetical protein